MTKNNPPGQCVCVRAYTYIMKFSNIIVFITFGTQIVYFVTIFVFCLKKFVNLLYIIPVHAFHSSRRKTHRYYIILNVCIQIFHFENHRIVDVVESWKCRFSSKWKIGYMVDMMIADARGMADRASKQSEPTGDRCSLIMGVCKSVAT